MIIIAQNSTELQGKI
jgi:aldehyde dehydrogenase (NAD+)